MPANPKLHELLAVEKNMENQSAKTRTELSKTFTDKRHLFSMKVVTFKPNADGSTAVTESQSDIQTTVTKEMEWLSGILAKSMDASYQIDLANTLAKADVVTEDGHTLATGLPATALLRLEHRMQEIHDLIVAIPTLDPAKGFQPDADKGAGFFKAREVAKSRTKKVFAPVVIVPATKEHPAQVEKLFEDVPTGTVVEQEWSSLITPAAKSELLDRCDILTRAIKKARSRANEQEVNVREDKVGSALLKYVFEPIAKA